MSSLKLLSSINTHHPTLLPLSLALIALTTSKLLPFITTMSSTQTALILSTVPGRLESISNHPIPLPEPHQLQIRITAAALNPHDQKSRDTGLFIKDLPLPAILGSDLAGVVTGIGSAVRKFKVGDRVFSQAKLLNAGHEQKALQQFAVVDEDFTAKISDGVDEQVAVALPTNLLAAAIGLFDREVGLGIPAPWSKEAADEGFDYAGTTLLIVGGGSNCGKLAVQLAKLAGLGRVIVIGGEEGELKRWGATHVLDRHMGNEVIVERIQGIMGGEKLVYVLDTVNSPEEQVLGISALSSGGTLARLRSSGGKLDEGRLVGEKKRERKAGEEAGEGGWYRLQNVLGLSHLRPETARPLWERIGGYILEGKIVAPGFEVVEGLDVDRANEVLDRYRDGERVIQLHFRVSR